MRKKEKKASPILTGSPQLQADEVAEIQKIGSTRNQPAGGVVLQEGVPDTDLYFILEGAVSLAKQEGGTLRRFVKLSAGAWFGAIPSQDPEPPLYTAVASSESRIIRFNSEQFESLTSRIRFHVVCRLHDLQGRLLRRSEKERIRDGNKIQRLSRELLQQRLKHRSDYRSSEMIRKVIAKVPRLPVFAGTLSNQLLNDRIGLQAISDQVKRDPSLVADVLRTINSPYYGLPQEISDIHNAVVLLGSDELYQIVMAASIKKTMPDKPKFREIHAHSVIISYILSALSSEMGIENPGEMSTIGLLHELGQTVVQLLKEQNPKFEMVINAFDHTQLGALLLKSWKMPEVVWRVVDNQSFPEFSLIKDLAGNIRQKVLLLHLAHLCCDYLRGVEEKDLPITFFSENKRYLKPGITSVPQLVADVLLPFMKKRIKVYPVPVKMLLKRHL